ncbi:MAG: hypothetical protein A2X18_01940 [Bacteroidetes bacterium GWF2_40_14]|nr:MAG: hypothetical protein A2X18_01940 [Bacteroidetes bacterium GWF2_40_14]
MRIKSEYKLRDIAGEKMLVMHGKHCLDLTKVVMLNKSAEFLWIELFNKNFSCNDAALLLQEKFSITNERAMNDARNWIDSMIAVALIEE